MSKTTSLAILGAGNIGVSIARGLVKSGSFSAGRIVLTRRKEHLLEPCKTQGFVTSSDNRKAVRDSDVVILAVEPQQIDALLDEIAGDLKTGDRIVVSVVSGVGIDHIAQRIGGKTQVVRAMPNTAVAIRESMTCLASNGVGGRALDTAREIFEAVGKTIVIDEEQMTAATALGACGIAFFLRAVRAASQGGVEIGFHADQALAIAAQAARGAASLLLDNENHPEREIDRVATPRGCTISGLNEMEHQGFSSALIKGIVTSAGKIPGLYSGDE